jgi:hypothetical protein
VEEAIGKLIDAREPEAVVVRLTHSHEGRAGVLGCNIHENRGQQPALKKQKVCGMMNWRHKIVLGVLR